MCTAGVLGILSNDGICCSLSCGACGGTFVYLDNSFSATTYGVRVSHVVPGTLLYSNPSCHFESAQPLLRPLYPTKCAQVPVALQETVVMIFPAQRPAAEEASLKPVACALPRSELHAFSRKVGRLIKGFRTKLGNFNV